MVSKRIHFEEGCFTVYANEALPGFYFLQEDVDIAIEIC